MPGACIRANRSTTRRLPTRWPPTASMYDCRRPNPAPPGSPSCWTCSLAWPQVPLVNGYDRREQEVDLLPILSHPGVEISFAALGLSGVATDGRLHQEVPSDPHLQTPGIFSTP